MTALALRGRTIELTATRPLLMGIVNTNPDSFSDATRLRGVDEQIAAGLALAADGAHIVDVGGESGVTYTDATASDVEIERVVPVIRGLAAEGVAVSVDTFKPAVARAALDAGAVMLNDVSGLRDPALAELAAQSGAALVVMHTRAAPKQEAFPDYAGGVVADVETMLAGCVQTAADLGVAHDQLVLDPGPDFAKSPAETVDVLRAVDGLAVHGRPLLLALSRKYFLGAITGRPPDQRLGATLGAVAWAARLRVASILRVHDVREVADLLAVLAVLEGDARVDEIDPDDERLKWLKA